MPVIDYLDELVTAAANALESSHPELAVPPALLRKLLTERAEADRLSPEATSELHLADLALAHCALRGQSAAIRGVTQVLRRACTKALGRAASEQVDEVVQRVLVRLLAPVDGGAARLAQYRGQASLARWFRVIAVREHQALARETQSMAETEGLEELPDRVLDLDLALAGRELQDAFKSAFQAAFAGLSIHERVLLRQNFRDGIAISDMASLHAVHRNTMARDLAQIRARLFNAVCSQLGQRLKVGPAELKEMLSPADLDVSLSRLFGDLPEHF